MEKKNDSGKRKERLLREVMVKIVLKQEEGIVVEVLLDSSATGLVMSEKFARKNKFRRMKLERLICMRNIDGTFNYARPIVDIVEVELLFKGYKERMSIDIIESQKQSVILGMLWLAHYNPEIDWKTKKVQIMRCPDKCGKMEDKSDKAKIAKTEREKGKEE